MSFIEAAAANLLSAPILFFVLGVVAALLRSDLDIPAPIGKALSMYLMVAIGFKGGLGLAQGLDSSMLWLAAAAVVLSLGTPFLAFALLRTSTSLGRIDAAAVAAHYGSVSVVTFVTAAAFLEHRSIEYAGAMVASLAIMETPAIISGLVLAGGSAKGPALREAMVNGSVVLLVGSLLIGLATGDKGADAMGPFLLVPFQGVLALFLLEMGLVAARRMQSFRLAGWRLVAFGLYMPLLGASLGLAVAVLLGLAPGDGALLAVLAGSASYIAVPAALRQALPEADPAIYVPLALGVTFPFNVVFGIPLYVTAAQFLLGG